MRRFMVAPPGNCAEFLTTADDIDGMRATGAPGARLPRILPGSHPFE